MHDPLCCNYNRQSPPYHMLSTLNLKSTCRLHHPTRRRHGSGDIRTPGEAAAESQCLSLLSSMYFALGMAPLGRKRCPQQGCPASWELLLSAREPQPTFISGPSACNTAMRNHAASKGPNRLPVCVGVQPSSPTHGIRLCGSRLACSWAPHGVPRSLC